MFKRGELTTQQLVVIIILIISFVVILFLFFRLNLGGETNKDICHNSVVMAGKTKTGSLDCKTTYVCISGGGDCEEFVATTTVDAKTEEDIVKIIQKEIKDCDWMFGEGKINYLKGIPIVKFDIPTLTHHCAICSSIKFDEKLKDQNINFNEELIDTNEKYSVYTGINSNIGEDSYISAKIIKSDDSTECGKYIHKA